MTDTALEVARQVWQDSIKKADLNSNGVIDRDEVPRLIAEVITNAPCRHELAAANLTTQEVQTAMDTVAASYRQQLAHVGTSMRFSDLLNGHVIAGISAFGKAIECTGAEAAAARAQTAQSR
jgi:hypothetical protein